MGELMLLICLAGVGHMIWRFVRENPEQASHVASTFAKRFFGK